MMTPDDEEAKLRRLLKRLPQLKAPPDLERRVLTRLREDPAGSRSPSGFLAGLFGVRTGGSIAYSRIIPAAALIVCVVTSVLIFMPDENRDVPVDDRVMPSQPPREDAGRAAPTDAAPTDVVPSGSELQKAASGKDAVEGKYRDGNDAGGRTGEMRNAQTKQSAPGVARAKSRTESVPDRETILETPIQEQQEKHDVQDMKEEVAPTPVMRAAPGVNKKAVAPLGISPAAASGLSAAGTDTANADSTKVDSMKADSAKADSLMLDSLRTDSLSAPFDPGDSSGAAPTDSLVGPGDLEIPDDGLNGIPNEDH